MIGVESKSKRIILKLSVVFFVVDDDVAALDRKMEICYTEA